jgi:alginate O-acetyltransferase complex protein AlgI
MMGFRFPINFNQPYRSISITDFWRRWHISLSSFLRDYLYIPLGGNRKGTFRTYVNLGLTMLLGGLWHGAAWNFVAWGAYQGFWLIIERLRGKASLWEWAPRPLKIALTFGLVIFGWVLFRAPDLSSAVSYAGDMLGFGASQASVLRVQLIHLLAGVAAVAVVWGARTTQVLIEKPAPLYAFSMQLLFLLAIAQVHFMDYVPFLYFQF